MKVVDSDNWSWFLFEHEGYLYLDANCNISALGYTYMIKLNEEELEAYRNSGREYLDKLAHDIHHSVPIAKDTNSIYKDRDVSNELSKPATEAVHVWRNNSDG
ncbi:MAG: hypothetical protein OEZ39_00635 [Gammaproteobacteria bacterium]|nr:hypothetical protein [Gammaproteobacteria bacterium]